MDKNQQKQMEAKLEEWKSDPVSFIEFFWPETKLWDKLREICYSVRDNRGTVVPSGHSVGKTYISAKIILWWLFTHYPSKVVTTAPTWHQISSILWAEIRTSLAKSKFPLVDTKNILQTELKLASDWFAIGISTVERVELREYGSTKFQGFHSENLLVVMDEAPGVDSSIHKGLETLATGVNNRILKIGNPTSPSGDFYKNCYSSQWNKISISAFDHPNIKNRNETIPGCVTVNWIDRVKEEWGEGSSLWKAKVLGEFPDETEDTLIPLSWCEIAVNTAVEPNERKVLGVDVARFGDDKSIVTEIKANIAKFLYTVQKESTMSLTGRINLIADNYDLIGIDGVGVGGGVVDRLRELLNDPLNDKEKTGYKVIDIQEGSKPTEYKRFFNFRSEMYWHLRERLRPDGLSYLKIKIPDDDELKAQLAGIKYDYSSDGRIKIESKEDMKKRGLKSPDKADSLAIAVWLNRPEKLKEITQNPIYKEFFQYKKEQRKSDNILNI